MKISCMAIDGYYVNMDFNDGGQVKENLDEIQNITVEVTCDSRTMEWIYSSVLDNGDVYTHTVTSANCLQNEEVPLNACSPTAITYLRDDPDFYVEPTDFGFTSTRIPDTTETISTMKISCMATDGNYVNMDFNEGYQAEDNLNMIQNITITVTCDSRNMNWIYTGPDPDTGGTIDFTVTTVECPQLPL
ncbi:hypothetical protein B9Z55_018804 [Caenorhabditis nigoni]|uniref:C6 domain-containing protein n=1 Tax=Caenorhabditis nigoni TaxID=1611254 RepID=A0A2G5TGH3_9PELO|nr:hypothetical protein B9Z55_018804 [Caenorhabditis nigoni]